MYNVCYYAPGGRLSVNFKQFQTFKDASNFAMTLPLESVF